jgi:hypothetical protein
MKIKVPNDWSEAHSRAQKDYSTVVGLKTATVWIQETADNTVLNGVYHSEGRNILESCVVLIPTAATPEVVESETDRFFKGVEQAIDASYARNLFLKWGSK